ncbi:MAG TPA: tyrosine-protein phosphatase [Verrucomicrobiae bacterium]|nr:tyrosine-protein phosphatase [Verrucomicrobiae bacterium]
MRWKPRLAPLVIVPWLIVTFIVAAANADNSNLSVSTASSQKSPSSKPSSEDPLIKNLHWMGLINGRTNILRCACPMMDIAEGMKSTEPTEEDLKLARDRMGHLRDLGIRTVVSFQHQDRDGEDDGNVEHRAVALERAAARDVGMTYVAFPMSNRGPHSFEDMSDDAVFKLLDPISDDIFKFAETGGVAFHCKSGKDRTGIMAAYLRLKYQHWTADEAIAEMRRYGHVWENFAINGATNSWHENHVRALAKMLSPTAP